MPDKPTFVAPVIVENIPSVAGGVSAIASAQAPFIYFDGAPNFGFNGGVANISLEAIRFTGVPGTNNVVADRITVAHLRMGVEGLRQLKLAIEGIELLAKPAADDKRTDRSAGKGSPFPAGLSRVLAHVVCSFSQVDLSRS